jgi:hypothetical protein
LGATENNATGKDQQRRGIYSSPFILGIASDHLGCDSYVALATSDMPADKMIVQLIQV